MDNTVDYKITSVKRNAAGKEEATIFETSDYHRAVSCYNRERQAGYTVTFDDVPRAMPKTA